MFNRYKEMTRKKSSTNGSPFLKPTFYPDIPERDTDIIHLVRYGERLELLAYRYYGDTALWWIISRANNLDPSDIGLKAATELRIPQDTGDILREFSAINNIE
tara:strand:- start:146 stop:454 length:309 start_codon:yes stop_codon:yes gene_type:complete